MSDIFIFAVVGAAIAALIVAAMLPSRKPPALGRGRGPKVIPLRDSAQEFVADPVITFTITSSREPVPTPVDEAESGASPPYFVGPRQTLKIADVTLEGPLVYVADCKSVPGADASLLCLRREFAEPASDPPKALGYWPRLSELRPYQAGNYVAWHAKGRKDPDIDLGYVFLYFYGLERRALIDGEDIVPIAQEVIRLLSIYGYSRSFQGYATALVAHLVMTGRLKPTHSLLERLIELQGRRIDDSLVNLLAGHLAKEKLPIRGKWAYTLASQDVRAHWSSVADRVPEELLKLFLGRYLDRYGDGLVLSPDDHDILLSYRAASPSLLPGTNLAEEIRKARWQGVHDWPRQFQPVVDLWNGCVDELRAFARKAGKEGKDSAAAFEHLPPELREADHPFRTAWDKLLAEFTPESGTTILPVSRLAEFRGLPTRERLSIAQSRSLAELVELLGTPLEPDPRYTGKPLAWDEHVAVLRLPEQPILPQTKNYLLAGTLLRLAVEVGRSDGEIDLDERRAINDYLGEHFSLSWNERIRLTGLLEVLLKGDASLSGLKKVLATHFGEDQRKAIGKFLVRVAARSGGVSPEETRTLEKSFKALALPAVLVEEYLAEVAGVAPTRPVRIAPEVESAGEAIPSPAALDLARIRQLRSESDEVARMLLDAMTDARLEDADEPAEAPTTAAIMPPPASPPGPASQSAAGNLKVDDLRPSLRDMLTELLTKEEWPPKDFEALARRHGTSAAASMEELNAWADEALGDFLLTEGATIRVDVRLVKQAMQP